MRWIWENTFSMDVPDEWKVREDGSVIEIEPPVPNGAVHISVLRRDLPHGVESGEASQLARDFARRQGITAPRIVERVEGDQHVAESHFETADSKGHYAWVVQAKVWPQRALVCSLCSDGKDDTLQRRARHMFNSVENVDALGHP